MRFTSQLLIVSSGLLWAAAASAAPPEPPMGQFNGAFYECDQGQGFEISYNSKSPQTATLTTSNNNRQYSLKRVNQVGGLTFSNGTVSVALTGSQAKVEGTAIPLADCKLKTTS